VLEPTLEEKKNPVAGKSNEPGGPPSTGPWPESTDMVQPSKKSNPPLREGDMTRLNNNKKEEKEEISTLSATVYRRGNRRGGKGENQELKTLAEPASTRTDMGGVGEGKIGVRDEKLEEGNQKKITPPTLLRSKKEGAGGGRDTGGKKGGKR